MAVPAIHLPSREAQAVGNMPNSTSVRRSSCDAKQRTTVESTESNDETRCGSSAAPYDYMNRDSDAFITLSKQSPNLVDEHNSFRKPAILDSGFQGSKHITITKSCYEEYKSNGGLQTMTDLPLQVRKRGLHAVSGLDNQSSHMEAIGYIQEILVGFQPSEHTNRNFFKLPTIHQYVQILILNDDGHDPDYHVFVPLPVQEDFSIVRTSTRTRLKRRLKRCLGLRVMPDIKNTRTSQMTVNCVRFNPRRRAEGNCA